MFIVSNGTKFQITKKYHFKHRFLNSGNTTKLNSKDGSITILTFNKLMGDDTFKIDRLGQFVKGSCGKYCNGCKAKCYVRRSYRYPSVKFSHARNTIAIRKQLHEVFEDINLQLMKKAKKFNLVIRIHQSGEFETLDELKGWCWVANNHTNKTFYVYTKAFDIVIPELLNGNVPKNLIVLMSVWHEYGINEYKKVAHLDNVKAFVYDDHDFNYSNHGINADKHCPAYDKNGNVDKTVTCDKCKMCFNHNNSHKIIFCYDH